MSRLSPKCFERCSQYDLNFIEKNGALRVSNFTLRHWTFASDKSKDAIHERYEKCPASTRRKRLGVIDSPGENNPSELVWPGEKRVVKKKNGNGAAGMGVADIQRDVKR